MLLKKDRSYFFMSEKLEVLQDIKRKIRTIRGKQVMFDSDLAELYGLETRVLNQAVKRNKERFPERFAFELSKKEVQKQFSDDLNLKSQNVTSNWGGRRKVPFVFTEQGVAMLSSVLKSKKAVEINVKIMDAFVAMRSFLKENVDVFNKLYLVESKVIKHDYYISMILDELQNKGLPEKGVFFNGQIFDAYKLVADLIKLAKIKIILIDNYVDENTLYLLSKKKKDVKLVIYTKNISRSLKQDVKKFNEQYKNLELKKFKDSHDRFLIIDEKIYHIGASLKDIGKKWFAFSKLNLDSNLILSKLD